MTLVDGRVSREKQHHVTLPSTIALQSDVSHFFRALFGGIKSNYVLSTWPKRHVIHLTNNGELEGIKYGYGAYIPGGVRTFTSLETVVNEDKNTLSYPIETLNSLSHQSALADHMRSLKKGVIVVLLRSSNPKNMGICMQQDSLWKT